MRSGIKFFFENVTKILLHSEIPIQENEMKPYTYYSVKYENLMLWLIRNFENDAMMGI